MGFNKHIAVIRLSAMGDVAMCVPVIRAFVAQHPNIKITFISKAFLKPLFKDIPNVSFFTADVTGKHKGIVGLHQLYKELKKEEITHLADLHNVLRSKIIRFFFSFTNIKIATLNKGRKEKKALTRVKNKIFKQLKTTHQRYVDVFKNLGFTIDITNPKPISKPVLTEQIKQLCGEKTENWIGIAPFATFESKIYPLDLMEEVIEKLSKKENYKLFLFGGKQDQNILESIAKKYNNTISVANKLGGLKNEIDLITHLDCMLSMDSGNAHFSAMQNVKTITLWGGTHPFTGFAPYNQPKEYCITANLTKFPNLPCSVYGNKTCKGYKNAMRSISTKTVIKKIEEAIKS